jgi:hypothetical protein
MPSFSTRSTSQLLIPPQMSASTSRCFSLDARAPLGKDEKAGETRPWNSGIANRIVLSSPCLQGLQKSCHVHHEGMQRANLLLLHIFVFYGPSSALWTARGEVQKANIGRKKLQNATAEGYIYEKRTTYHLIRPVFIRNCS